MVESGGVELSNASVRPPDKARIVKWGVLMSFRVETRDHAGRTVYSLHDDATGARASVLPAYGFNLFDLRLPLAGEPRPVLVASPDFPDQPAHPAGNGTPILFPFPNRIRDARFTFDGRTYQLPATNGPNAIHGFAMTAAWDVIEHKAGADHASIVGSYQISKHSPESRALWPADALLQVAYVLAGRRLSMTVTVSNPGAADLPYGFGIHPYFRLPFSPGGDPAQTQVILPASSYWVLKDFLPTGEIRPVDSRLDFRTGKPRNGLELDDVLTGLQYQDRRGVARLVDLEKKAEFRLTFDEGIRELVVYTPPRKPDVLAVEPYTQTTDAINLQPQGKDAGLRLLAHGRHDTFSLTMETLG
jgi:aldose 1-epimerase